MDTLAGDHCLDPEELIINKENYNSIGIKITEILSKLELTILVLYLQGESYQKIAKHLARDSKSIDNALQRVKKKLEKQLKGSGQI